MINLKKSFAHSIKHHYPDTQLHHNAKTNTVSWHHPPEGHESQHTNESRLSIFNRIFNENSDELARAIELHKQIREAPFGKKHTLQQRLVDLAKEKLSRLNLLKSDSQGVRV